MDKFKDKTFVEYINAIEGYNYTEGYLGNLIDDVAQNLFYLEKNLFDKIIILC